jgi:vacuolar-type H+-ATPase subunit H
MAKLFLSFAVVATANASDQDHASLLQVKQGTRVRTQDQFFNVSDKICTHVQEGAVASMVGQFNGQEVAVGSVATEAGTFCVKKEDFQELSALVERSSESQSTQKEPGMAEAEVAAARAQQKAENALAAATKRAAVELAKADEAASKALAKAEVQAVKVTAQAEEKAEQIVGKAAEEAKKMCPKDTALTDFCKQLIGKAQKKAEELVDKAAVKAKEVTAKAKAWFEKKRKEANAKAKEVVAKANAKAKKAIRKAKRTFKKAKAKFSEKMRKLKAKLKVPSFPKFRKPRRFR